VTAAEGDIETWTNGASLETTALCGLLALVTARSLLLCAAGGSVRATGTGTGTVLSQDGEPGPRVYTPRNRVAQLHLPGTGFPFRRLLTPIATADVF
jgi:hypothetical protein